MAANAVEQAGLYFAQAVAAGAFQRMPDGRLFTPFQSMIGGNRAGATTFSLVTDTQNDVTTEYRFPDAAPRDAREAALPVAGLGEMTQYAAQLTFAGTGGVNVGGNQGINFGLPEQKEITVYLGQWGFAYDPSGVYAVNAPGPQGSSQWQAFLQGPAPVLLAALGSAAISQAIGATAASATAAGEGAIPASAVGEVGTGAGESITGAAGAAATTAGGSVSATQAALSGSAAGTAATAGNSASASQNAVNAGAASQAAQATAASANSLSNIVSSVKDVVGTLKDTIGGILAPIADTLHQVTGLVKDINDNLINPIVKPIQSIISSYDTLQKTITADLHSGVKGLLDIPQTLSNALTSVDATMQRSIAVLSTANQNVIHQELGPGVAFGVSAGYDHMSSQLSVGLDKYNGSEFDGEMKHLHDTASEEDIARAEQKILSWVGEQMPGISKLAGTVLDVLMSALLILSYLEAKNEVYKQIGRQKFPSELLPEDKALEAGRRKLIDEDSVNAELGKRGFSADRIDVLKSLDRALPSAQDALDWRARKLIDDGGLADLLNALGWREDDQQRLKDQHVRLLDIDAVLAGKRRGLIDAAEAEDMLGAYDLRKIDQDRLEELALSLPGIADLMRYADRQVAIQSNIAPDSLTKGPPQALVEQSKVLGIEADSLAVLWANHFSLLPSPLAVQAYFRGYISLDMCHACLASDGLAQEQWQNYIDLQRPVLPARTVPSYLAAGIIDQPRALDILRQNGYSDNDARLLIEFGLHKIKPSHVAAVDSLHGLTRSTITALYADGVMERATAAQHLEQLGLGADAAELTLQLVDINQHAQERRAEIGLIEAQAKAGEYDITEASNRLGAIGATPTETARALASIERATAVKAKLPSESQVESMYKHSIIDRKTALFTLGQLGYSATWAERLTQLAEASNRATTTSGSTAPANPTGQPAS